MNMKTTKHLNPFSNSVKIIMLIAFLGYCFIPISLFASTAPTVTTNAASSVTSSSATLNGSVNPNGSNTGYLFEYGTTISYGTNTTSTIIGSGTSTLSESASITGLLSNTTYHFRIMAMNSIGTSYGSDRTFTTTAAGQAPTVPSNPNPSNGATGVSISPTLSWTSTVSSGSISFDLYISTSPTFTTSTLYSGSGTSTSISGLSQNTTYYWKVISYANGLNSGWSSVWSFTTIAPPTVPSSPNPTNGATGIATSPTLSWTSTVSSGTISFDLYLSTSPTFTTSTLYSGSGTSTSVSGLSQNTTYYWKAISYANGLNSGWSSVWSFTTATPSPPTVPNNPNPANGATGVATSPTLSWTSTVSSGTISFDLYLSTSPTFTTSTLYSGSGTSTSVSVLSQNTTYYWKAISYANGTNSGWSSVWSFTTATPSPPSVPINPNPTNGATGVATSPTLSWTSTVSSGTISFDLYISTSPTFTTSTLYSGSGTSTSVSVLLQNTTYYWKAISYANGTNSGWSSVWSFTTATLSPPTIPSNPNPANGATGLTISPTLSWTSTVSSGTISFDLYISTSPTFATSTLYSGSGTSTSVSGLSQNTTYYWKAISYANGFNSGWSSVWSFTTATLLPPTVPINPNPANGATGITTSPTLSWTSTVSSGTISFDLYISTSPTFATNTLYSGVGTSKSISGLLQNTTYYWKAISYANGFNSGWSSVWNFTTINTTSCIFSDCFSPTNCGNTNYQDTTFLAVQYLCSHNIVSSSNDSVKPNGNITRAQLAKITLYGVFGDSLLVPKPLVSDYFPSPYTDLQDTGTYYYKAAKALMYLDYGDGITPFDRDKLNFFPSNTIDKIYVFKVLLEAFNIAPDNNGPSPFTNVPVNNQFYGYVHKAYELGITHSTTFQPNVPCTRAEAFIMLYRMMTHSPSLFPTITNTLDPSSSSFFIPFNMTPDNISSNKGLETGNFNLYTKSSFEIPGRNMSLDFAHTYNSCATELPDEITPIKPLGIGWSHTYNAYMTAIAGDTSINNRYLFHWPDGTINVYKSIGGNFKPVTLGVHDQFIFVSGTEVHIKTKNQITYVFQKIGSYTPAFMLTSIVDRNSNTINISYETVNNTPRVKEVADPSGRKLIYAYQTGSNLLQSVTDPLGRVISFNYTNGQLTAFTDAKSQNTTYTYGTGDTASYLLKTIHLPKGNVINNQYQQRKLTSTKYNNNSPTTIAHTPNYVAGNNDFYKTSVTVPQQGGQSITTNYDFNKNENITHANGNPALDINSQYTDSNNPTLPSGITNNNSGVTVTPTYDANGNVTQLHVNGNGLITDEYYQYNSLNDVTQHIDANGNITNYTYTNGNLTKVKDALNNETNIAYALSNFPGQPSSITNPNGVTVNFNYNIYGNQNQVSIAGVGSSSMIFDASSRMTSTTNFAGQTTSYAYDNNDNLMTETDALGNITSYAYDLNDNMTSITNAKGYATSFSYDYITDWLLSETFQGATKAYTYNYDGSLNTFTCPNGNVLNYTYDNSGRVSSDGYSNYNYLTNGNLSSITKISDGKVISLGYDGLNRINSVTYDGANVTVRLVLNFQMLITTDG